MASPRVLDAYRDGLRRVAAAPWVWIGAWVTTLLLAVPLAVVLRDMIGTHLGSSLAAETAASGVNWDWWQEFRQQATGLGTTFGPSVIGFASVLRHVSDLLDNGRMAPVLAGVVSAWLVLWSFLSGGMLDRFARNRPTWASGFFAACGTHFFRFLRLGLVALAAYYVLFAWVHPWLFDRLWTVLTRNVAVERTAFLVALALYGVFASLLLVVSLVFDYARVRIVVEDRRSALGAVAAAARFLRRHAVRVLLLYGLIAATFLVMAAIYWLVAPRAGSAGLGLWLGIAVAQAWILARIWLKLVTYASAVSLFQGELAHADYAATAIPEWPESPAAEALRGDPPVQAVP